MMTFAEVRTARLRSLLLTSSVGTDPVDIVDWFGSMQAQDYNSGLWSLGSRIESAEESAVAGSLESGALIRTWTQRGTIHLVRPHDAPIFLATCGTRPRASAQRRREQLGIRTKDADAATEVLAEAIADSAEQRLTRSQCAEALTAAGIEINSQRLYHLLWFAAQQGVTYIGPPVGREQTVCLLANQVTTPLERDADMGWLALRYFRSHGPTTRTDFAGWAGISQTEAKTGIAAAGDSLEQVLGEANDGEPVPMWAHPDVLTTTPAAAPAMRMIAPYDEYLLGYKDRCHFLSKEDESRVVPGGNGVFRGTFVDGEGMVRGTWKRPTAAKIGRVPTDWFPNASANSKRRASDLALPPYSHFLGRELTIASS